MIFNSFESIKKCIWMNAFKHLDRSGAVWLNPVSEEYQELLLKAPFLNFFNHGKKKICQFISLLIYDCELTRHTTIKFKYFIEMEEKRVQMLKNGEKRLLRDNHLGKRKRNIKEAHW